VGPLPTGKRAGTTASAPGTVFSVRVLLEHRLDASGPVAVKLLEQLLGRGDAAHDEILHGLQITTLVMTRSVEPPPSCETFFGQCDRCFRELQYVLTGNRRGE